MKICFLVENFAFYPAGQPYPVDIMKFSLIFSKLFPFFDLILDLLVDIPNIWRRLFTAPGSFGAFLYDLFLRFFQRKDLWGF